MLTTLPQRLPPKYAGPGRLGRYTSRSTCPCRVLMSHCGNFPSESVTMAEPVGLILSTVGLVSLFTTCIELIDYFELSKTYEYDYEMACLKLSLLKSRLDTWGQMLQ